MLQKAPLEMQSLKNEKLNNEITTKQGLRLIKKPRNGTSYSRKCIPWTLFRFYVSEAKITIIINLAEWVSQTTPIFLHCFFFFLNLFVVFSHHL
jgi:hypothetical protein